MSTFEELAQLLAEERHEPLNRILPTTRLREDLGIDGDDWGDIFVRIQAKWDVSWGSFDCIEYFDPEPSLWAFVSMFTTRWRFGPKKPLTVSHLVSVIDRKAWFEPDSGAA